MQHESHYVKANGINQHYLQWGEPKNPPLVMLHGIGLCAQVWNWVANHLAQDYHIMSFDLRGHGDTDKPGSGYNFHQLGVDLAEAVKVLDLKQPYAVGHSAGGTATIIANSLAPGVLGPTVLVDTRVGVSPVFTSPEDRKIRVERTRQKRAIWNSREEMYAAYRERRVFKSWTDDIFRDYIEGGTRLLEDGRVELKCPTDVEATYYQERANLDTSPYLKGLTGNYSLLLGNYPGAQKPEDEGVQQFLREVESARVKTLDQGSHFVPMEYPELVLNDIRQFFNGGHSGKD